MPIATLALFFSIVSTTLGGLPGPCLAGPGPQFDCNGNGIEDAVDISFGTSSDVNQNGVPDECERG